jgi:hypothetical protein
MWGILVGCSEFDVLVRDVLVSSVLVHCLSTVSIKVDLKLAVGRTSTATLADFVVVDVLPGVAEDRPGQDTHE